MRLAVDGQDALPRDPKSGLTALPRQEPEAFERLEGGNLQALFKLQKDYQDMRDDRDKWKKHCFMARLTRDRWEKLAAAYKEKLKILGGEEE